MKLSFLKKRRKNKGVEMNDKKQRRLRRARKTRLKIADLKAVRFSVHRTNNHIYAQIISNCGCEVLASASTLEVEIRAETLDKSGKLVAKKIGKLVAERAQKIGIIDVAFDRSGFQYHGRVKALAEAAREAGLKF